MAKEQITLGLLVIGALGIVGAVTQGAVAESPATVGVLVLLMLPYPYLQFKQGMKEGATAGTTPPDRT